MNLGFVSWAQILAPLPPAWGSSVSTVGSWRLLFPSISEGDTGVSPWCALSNVPGGRPETMLSTPSDCLTRYVSAWESVCEDSHEVPTSICIFSLRHV